MTDYSELLTELRSHWESHHRTLKGDMSSLMRSAEVLMQENRELKELIMALQVDVQNMVDQVARNTSIEESSALALAGLVAKSADLDAQVKVLTDRAAQGGTLSPEDVSALQGASGALLTSAQRLQAAVPQNTNTQPVEVQPPPPTPPEQLGMRGGPGGQRRF